MRKAVEQKSPLGVFPTLHLNRSHRPKRVKRTELKAILPSLSYLDWALMKTFIPQYKELYDWLLEGERKLRQGDDLGATDPLGRELVRRIRELQPEALNREQRAFALYQKERQAALEALEAGDPNRLFHLLALYGPFMLIDWEILWIMKRWWLSKSEDDAALKNLRQIGNSLAALGSGKTPKLSPAQRAKKKQTSNYASGTRRNHRQIAERLVEQVKKQEAYLIKMQRRPSEPARKEAITYVVSQFQRTSRAKDKKAILSIFKELLKNDCQQKK